MATKILGVDDMAGKIALGATGVALAAGAIIAGVALTNPKTRQKIANGTKSTVKRLRRVGEVIQEGKHRYQAVQHRIGLSKRKKTPKQL